MVRKKQGIQSKTATKKNDKVIKLVGTNNFKSIRPKE